MQFYTWALLSTTPQCRFKKKCIFTTYLAFYTKFAHKYSLYVAKRGAKRGRQRGNVVERGFAAFNEANHVNNAAKPRCNLVERGNHVYNAAKPRCSRVQLRCLVMHLVKGTSFCDI